MPETYLVTGANRGLGLALATGLANQGYKVFATARDAGSAEKLNALVAQHPSLVTVLPMDVTSDESVRAAFQALQERNEQLDVIINNAGIHPEDGKEKLAELDLRTFTVAYETNVVGPARVIARFQPLLSGSQNPRIVNISSGAGSISNKNDSDRYAYAASKAALNMVTRGVAAEMTDITVISMCPGWVKTDMGGQNAHLTPDESARAILQTISQLTREQSGTFMDRQGHPLPY